MIHAPEHMDSTFHPFPPPPPRPPVSEMSYDLRRWLAQTDAMQATPDSRLHNALEAGGGRATA